MIIYNETQRKKIYNTLNKVFQRKNEQTKPSILKLPLKVLSIDISL